MRKSLYVFWLLSIGTSKAFGGSVPAGSSVDSVKAIQASGSETDKIVRLNRYAMTLLEEKRLQETEYVVETALELARKANFQAGIAAAYDNLGLIAQAKSDDNNAMNYFVESLRIRDGLGDKIGIACSKNYMGRVFFLQNNESAALTHYQKALEALPADAKDKRVPAMIRKNLGDLYLSQKVYGKATAEYNQALNDYTEANDLQKAASIASFLGKTVSDLGDYDGAQTYFNASLNFHRTLEDETGVAKDFLNLAKVFNALNDRQLALENAQNATSIFEQKQDKFGMAESYQMMGYTHLRNSDRNAALKFFDKAGEILKKLPIQKGVPEIYQAIALSYDEMSDFPRAFEFQKAFSNSKDSLFNKEKATALLDMTAKYESQYAVKEKNRQLELLEHDKDTNRKIQLLLLGLLGLAVYSVFNFYQNYKSKKADNDKLMLLNEQIQGQNNSIVQQKAEIDLKNAELNEKNVGLDALNERLLREMAERELSQNTLYSKDHFLANVTREMGSPLNAIVGLSHLLMTQEPRKDQKDHIQNLQFAANNLLVLINDVLDFSKIEAGKLSLETIDFSPEDILSEIKKEIQSDKTVQIEYTVSKDIPHQLNGDPVRLTQIMTYMLNNIRNLLIKGTIYLDISRAEELNHEIMVKIDLSMNGEGANHISKFLKKIVERTDFEGAGNDEMELIIAKRLIELQNGTFWTGLSEKGTTATIYLPYKLSVADAATEKTDGNMEGVPAETDPEYLKDKRVLVVEDNKVNQMLVVNMLKKQGIVVTAAGDGIEALEKVAKQDFDLILMDIQMPRMDGYRAVAEIRKMPHAEKSIVPIIAFTASAYVNEKEKAQLFGMTDHIGKPFSPDELLEKVQRVMLSHKANISDHAMPQQASAKTVASI
jgi:CheY-like chemotaxis protein/signal transduction histidine kinase